MVPYHIELATVGVFYEKYVTTFFKKHWIHVSPIVDTFTQYLDFFISELCSTDKSAICYAHNTKIHHR